MAFLADYALSLICVYRFFCFFSFAAHLHNGRHPKDTKTCVLWMPGVSFPGEMKQCAKQNQPYNMKFVFFVEKRTIYCITHRLNSGRIIFSVSANFVRTVNYNSIVNQTRGNSYEYHVTGFF